MIRTERIDTERAFTELADEWDDLVRRSMTNTPFQTLAYQRGWWQHLHPAAADLYTIALRQEDGRLSAIACFYLLDGVLYFNGCTQETDYLDLIVAAADAEMAWTAVFDCLCDSDFPEWNALDFCNVPAASPTRPIVSLAAEKRGFFYQESVHEVCPVITLPATFEAYLDNLDSKQRREIQRKLRRADGAEVVWRIVKPTDNLAQEVDEFLELLQKSTFEKRDWLTEGRRALFQEAAVAAMDAGMLQLLFMEVNGRKAAALFNFDYNNRIWVYNSGLDPALAGNLSLGVVITAKAIAHAIENGRAEFDFLRGNETYKYRFGAQDTIIYRQQIGKR